MIRKVTRTKSFLKDYKALPKNIQKRVKKSLMLFASDITHPSLRIKKTKSREDIWEGTITTQYRFTFQIVGDSYLLRRVGKHKETP